VGEEVVGDVGEVAELEAGEVEGEELLLCELVTGGDGVGLVDVDDEEEPVGGREELCWLIAVEVVIVDG
jgi:hypothetical protein